MTEFSTNNDSTKTHFSQPLQNSPRHYNSSHSNYTNLSFQNQTSNPLNQNHQKQALLLTNNAKITSSSSSTVKHTTPTSSTQSSANTSPLHYRNPFNSPSNSPFVISHVNPSQQHQQQQQQQLQLQQYLYRQKLSLLSQNQYQQHLYDILKQQQHLQKLLSAKDKECSRKNDGENDDNDDDDANDQIEKSQQNVKDATNADDERNENDEISDESLKQNVAIVLNNLDRYNNALRSVILNEQINSNSSYLFDDNSLLNSNHNFLFNNIHCKSNSNKNNNNNIINNNNNTKNNNNSSVSGGNILNKKMATATAATPESDYNSNATTPGSRSNMLTYDNNMQQQQQQQQNNMVGFNITTGGPAVGGSTAISAGITSVNNIGCVGGGNGFASNNQYTNNGGIGNNGFCNNLASLSNNLNCSFASSHDFTHDNSDYQWFLDYGYRDGAGGMQRSVLSSLSASYNGFGDLVQYEDLAKNLDANLAEVDMESFRAEDIHLLLSQLPTYCKNLTGLGLTNGIGNGIIIGGHTSLEQSYNNFLQQEQLHNMLPVLGGGAHNMSTTSSNEPIDTSICKSELLFSPVKESHISVDSLDMDGYPDDGDIILTCQANKDNYTIAFEGSMLYSDESFCEPSEMALKNKQNFMKLHNIQDVNLRKALEASMSQSNRDYSPNMNQQNAFTINQLQRCPSGNNNTNINANTIVLQRPKTNGSVRKSSSLPNLHDDTENTSNNEDSQQVLNVSEAVSTSTMEHCKSRNLLPMCQMPVSASASISEQLSSITQYQEQNYHRQGVQNHNHGVHHRHKHRCCCSHLQNSSHGIINGVNVLNSQQQHQQEQQEQQQSQQGQHHHHHHGQSQKNSNISGSASSGNSNPAAFNLVKLFIKQKSSNCSSDDGQVISTHTCMDVSSGCWPSSEAVGSSSSSSLEQRIRKKSMHDSGKGSALSRHDEEDLCGDSKDDRRNFPKEHSTPKKALNSEQMSYDEDPSSSSTGSLTATNSPAHRKRSVPLRNPQIQNIALHNTTGGSSTQSTDASHSNSEQLTQIYAGTGVALERRRSKRSTENQRPISTASSSEMITRSMQTSCGSSSTRSSVSDRLRCVPPSFLSKLSELGDERKAPIYVIYPDYALPDLGFVKTGTAPEIIFSPFNYKMTIGSSPMASSGLKKRFSLNGNDDDELLKTMDFKHIVDWDSLATLLPIDYRRRLKHIPQVNSILPQLEAELSYKPLFCIGPSLRRNRTNVCDCEKYLTQEQQNTNQNQNPIPNSNLNQTQIHVQEGSSSSGSSQQPSSGYRGSSTLLTDSELDNNSDPMKQMFVYQYEQQRMDSGVETSPSSVTKPTPMPRGILRKTISQATTRTKRNSMIEDQQTKASKLEKRRSLQEPPSNYGIGSAEELTEVFEEDAELYAIPKPRSERLSRKDLDARARARAESFLSSIPRSELKYYAEIASVLESSEHKIEYDAAALKKEVSRALSQQKKVSFNDEEQDLTPVQEQPPTVLGSDKHKRFSTPPNSPNISLANNAARSSSSSAALPRRLGTHIGSTIEEKEMRKIESNRFKRLQIQWELMSKDTNMLKDIVSAEATKSGGSTPTSANANKSRIPRPVSYPAGKRTDKSVNSDKPDIKCDRMSSKNVSKKVINDLKTTIKPSIVSPRIRVTGQDVKGSARSPSRIVPPKRYSIAGSPSSTGYGKQSATSPATPTGQNCGGVFTPNRSRTPNSRVATTAPNTPKKRVQSPRTVPRVR